MEIQNSIFNYATLLKQVQSTGGTRTEKSDLFR